MDFHRGNIARSVHAQFGDPAFHPEDLERFGRQHAVRKTLAEDRGQKSQRLLRGNHAEIPFHPQQAGVNVKGLGKSVDPNIRLGAR